ncbi:MAG: aspartate aminotransferase family protein [Chloroflexota bacterium]|nr:MAG: aspartate aminotransferase family protein [Chloroflexota bacterium]
MVDPRPSVRRSMLDFVQMRDFERDPLVIERGDGVRVWDTDGTAYIDGLSGIFVVNMGHGRREIIDAVSAQLGKIAFAPQMAMSPPEIELAERLVAISPPSFSQVKFHSGGSEATEAAIKMARQYHRQTGNPGKYKIVSHYRGYHGATGHALAATGWPHLRAAFEPFAAGFVRVHTPDPYRPIAGGTTLDEIGVAYARLVDETIALEGPSTVAAIIVEPIMMSAGIIVPPPGYLAALRRIADTFDVLLIFDEIITGFGRTGKLFCREHSGVLPDLFCVGKGVSGGYAPLSAVVLSERVADAFWGDPGAQFQAGHTFAGNPVACAAGLAAIDVLLSCGVLENGAAVGQYAKERMRSMAERHPSIGDVRGEGMFLGFEFVTDRSTRARFPDSVTFGQRVQAEARRRGLLVRAGGWFLAVGPPLTITRSEMDEMLDILDASISVVEREVGVAEPAIAR